MSKLTTEHKRFIVQHLACFESPSEVQRAVRETFNVDVSLPHILYYDPDSAGTKLAREWRTLHAETRQAFTKQSASIAISHKHFRLRRIEAMARRLEAKAAEQRSPVTQAQLFEQAAKLYEQAAKEMGESYTNRRVLTPGDPLKELAALLGLDEAELQTAIGGMPSPDP